MKRMIYTLPVASSVSAVDRNNQRFWYFNNATATIGSLPMVVIQSPSITQQPAPSTSVALGNSVYLTVTALGFSPLSINGRWVEQMSRAKPITSSRYPTYNSDRGATTG